MIGYSIYFNKNFTNKELVIAIAKVFKIALGDIVIVDDICELLDKNIEYKIVCERYNLVNNVEFKLRLDINSREVVGPKQDIEVYSSLINILNCKLLVDNYLVTPNSMLVIESIYLTEEDLNREIY